MSEAFAAQAGGVLSADIAVPEHEREVRFYSRVLSTGENPLWRHDLMNNLGMPIIGLGAQSAEYAGLPLQWMPHIQVADVATSARRALELGGSELMHAKDDEGGSQWAVLLDPNAAAFGIIPVVPAEAIPASDGAEARGGAASVGRIGWLDLTVSDAASTRDFYRQVVGWSVQDVEMEDAGEGYADYQMLAGDGIPAAGVCHARGVNLGLPPVWMIYLPVGDLAESLRRVQDEGGKNRQGNTGNRWGVRLCGDSGSGGGVPGVDAGVGRCSGMARALIAMACVRALILVVALITRLGHPWSGPLELLGLNGFFVALFVGSAWLFRQAARARPERSA